MAALISILKRVARMVGVVLTVTLVAFAALNFLGDPLFNILGPIVSADPADLSESDLADIAEAQELYHLDEPFVIRYGQWLGDIAQGDFGRSFKNGTSVSSLLRDRFPVTILLMVLAQGIALAISVPWALLTASRAYRATDRVSTVVSFAMLGIPVFALSVVLFWLFSVRLDLFPTRYDDANFIVRIWSLVLPAVVLATPLIAIYQRLLRTDLVSTLQEDFIAVARAKGMPARHILIRHALRPSLFSLITVFGIQTGALIGGSLVVETYFTLPGIGAAIVEAIIRDDFPVVLAAIVVITIFFVVTNFLVDLAYSFLDPRVRIDE